MTQTANERYIEAKIRIRLAEVQEMLKAGKWAPGSIGGDLMQIARLEGNIGALEWVLRLTEELP